MCTPETSTNTKIYILPSPKRDHKKVTERRSLFINSNHQRLEHKEGGREVRGAEAPPATEEDGGREGADKEREPRGDSREKE